MINPIDQTQENLRTNLLTSLINTYKFNFESNGKSHRYYEINNVYDDSKHKKFHFYCYLLCLNNLFPDRFQKD